MNEQTEQTASPELSRARRTLSPLERCRVLAGHSQESLGQAAGGLHRNTVAAIESGRTPTRRTAVRLAVSLGVRPGELFPDLKDGS